MWWDSNCITWTLAEQSIDNSRFDDPVQQFISFDELRTVVRSSFQTWEDVDCSFISFVETEPTHCLDVGLHQQNGNANRIFFRSTGWVDPSAVWRADDQIALTSVFHDTDTGEILDVDIEFNAEYFELTTLDEGGRTDIQNALTHEIGHVIGLGHSADRDATMYLNAQSGELSKRDLSDDDIAGLCALYPDNEADQYDCLAPIGGLDVDCETADSCGDPVDGFLVDCSFDESVCCCDSEGGFGNCEWAHATTCRDSSRYAIIELDRFVSCVGDPPVANYTCCCRLESDGAQCDWASFEDCSDSGGYPSAYPIYSTDLCGPFPAQDGCQCRASSSTAASFMTTLLRLINFPRSSSIRRPFSLPSLK